MRNNKLLDRLDQAFHCPGTCTSILCKCGRVHFTSGPGCGDYEDGELEELQGKAEKDPDRYVEDPLFGRIDWLPWNGEQLVLGCPCGKAQGIAEGIEGIAEELAAYLKLYFEDRLAGLALETKAARAGLAAVDRPPGADT